MTAEEYTTYKTQDYPMSATVGKDGAELAFEKYLHGTNGTAIVTKNAVCQPPASLKKEKAAPVFRTWQRLKKGRTRINSPSKKAA